MVTQGELYWVDLGSSRGAVIRKSRPVVIVQNDAFNASRIQTVIVCPLTTNLRRASAPGNVLLGEGEAGLTRQSVVNISQILTLDREEIQEKIGKLSAHRIEEIVKGIKLAIEPREVQP